MYYHKNLQQFCANISFCRKCLDMNLLKHLIHLTDEGDKKKHISNLSMRY